MFDRFPTDEALKGAIYSYLTEAVGDRRAPTADFDRWGSSGVGVTWTANGYQLRIHAWLEGGALTREVRTEAAAWRDDRERMVRRVIFLPSAATPADASLYQRLSILRERLEDASDDVERAPTFELMPDPREHLV